MAAALFPGLKSHFEIKAIVHQIWPTDECYLISSRGVKAQLRIDKENGLFHVECSGHIYHTDRARSAAMLINSLLG